MGNSFIERLTDEQIKAFFDSRFLVYKYTYSVKKDSTKAYIAVQLSAPDGIHNYIFEDYSSSNAQEHWLKYLSQIFGEEYYSPFRNIKAKVAHFKNREAV